MKSALVSAIALALALTACGKQTLDATYSGGPAGTLVFKPNGKVIFDGIVEMDYELDGRDIRIFSPGQPTQMAKILDDGSIRYSIFGAFKKVSK